MESIRIVGSVQYRHWNELKIVIEIIYSRTSCKRKYLAIYNYQHFLNIVTMKWLVLFQALVDASIF